MRHIRWRDTQPAIFSRSVSPPETVEIGRNLGRQPVEGKDKTGLQGVERRSIGDMGLEASILFEEDIVGRTCVIAVEGADRSHAIGSVSRNPLGKAACSFVLAVEWRRFAH
ncbi:hypothetical protein GGE18_000331 [Rhizobium esperanzae]|nr:hypothetical protein [Rhizobium esperanzae]